MILTTLQVFENIQQKCGLLHPSGSSSPQKLTNPTKDKSLLVSMAISEFQDIVFYMADIGITLSSFLEVYTPAADIFLKENFINRYIMYLILFVYGFPRQYLNIVFYMADFSIVFAFPMLNQKWGFLQQK